MFVGRDQTSDMRPLYFNLLILELREELMFENIGHGLEQQLKRTQSESSNLKRMQSGSNS